MEFNVGPAVAKTEEIDTVLYMNIYTYVYRDSAANLLVDFSPLYQDPKLGTQ